MVSTSCDRRWPLQIVVDSPNKVHKSTVIRVRGDYTIGNVMAQISEEMGSSQDLSDYALWWPAKKRWLKQCRMTLDQLDVYANSELHFTTMHKNLWIQMTDLRNFNMSVDFSANVLNVVANICNEMNIRFSEELSLTRPLSSSQLKRNNPNVEASPLQRSHTPTLDNFKSQSRINMFSNGTLSSKSNGSLHNTSFGTNSSNGSINSLASPDSRDILVRPKSMVEKARLNSAWLNSSISLYEQDVHPGDLLLLKFKFYTFFSLNPKIDLARINLIYEQLKCSIQHDELTCTEDEMYTLAGINLQVNICSGAGNILNNKSHNGKNGYNGNGLNGSYTNGFNGNGKSEFNHYSTYDSPKRNGFNYVNRNGHNGYHHNQVNQPYGTHNGDVSPNGFNGNNIDIYTNGNDISEIDSALENLEKTLLGTSLDSKSSTKITNGKHMNGNGNLNFVPELCDKLKFTSQKTKNYSTLSRLKLNTEKSYYVLFRDTTLIAYKPSDFDQTKMVPKEHEAFKLNLTSCEVKPNVLVSQQRFCFQIIESSEDGVIEHSVKCRGDKQYAEWFTACKQASIGRTMAHASYKEELDNTLRLLQIQSSVADKKNNLKLDNLTINPEDYVSIRFLKRKSKEQVINKIQKAYLSFSTNSTIEAQMNYIKTCQSLRDFGITLFVVRFTKSKKEELLGVTPDKLVVIDMNTGSVQKSWRYRTLIDWNVNWEVKKMQLNFDNENVEFECLSADCKVVHEFIGGYIYLSMRTSEHCQLKEENFLRLTGGWNEQIEELES